MLSRDFHLFSSGLGFLGRSFVFASLAFRNSSFEWRIALVSSSVLVRVFVRVCVFLFVAFESLGWLVIWLVVYKFWLVGLSAPLRACSLRRRRRRQGGVCVSECARTDGAVVSH